MSRHWLTTVGACAALALLPTLALSAAPVVSAAIKAAVADAGRPAAESKRDLARHPAETLAFAGVKPGDKVVDLMPGGGYFTRLFARTVGPKGHVWAMVPGEFLKFQATYADEVKAAAMGYENVTVTTDAFAGAKLPEKVDVVFTAQNYHDIHAFFPQSMTDGLNQAAFRALKPGGVYLVIDHAAAPGSGGKDSKALHRIDPALVKAEVTGAGFRFAGEQTFLANPADDHTLKVFDPKVQGHTDQFVYKFVKPKK